CIRDSHSGQGGDHGSQAGDGKSTTCPVDVDSANCVDNTNPNSAGSQPVAQGKAKEELAETGAGQTTFLLTGAATMIAG
ncbi:hypothetical protein ADK38_00475, partial [Streptomyces varsoviensis]